MYFKECTIKHKALNSLQTYTSNCWYRVCL